MKNYLNEPNPLNHDAGKGSRPRNLSKKFRKNYDQINWGKRPVTRKGGKFISKVNPGSSLKLFNGKVYLIHPDHKPKIFKNGKFKYINL